MQNDIEDWNVTISDKKVTFYVHVEKPFRMTDH